MNRVEFDKLEEINFATKVDEMGSMKVEIFISHLSIFEMIDFDVRKIQKSPFSFFRLFYSDWLSRK